MVSEWNAGGTGGPLRGGAFTPFRRPLGQGDSFSHEYGTVVAPYASLQAEPLPWCTRQLKGSGAADHAEMDGRQIQMRLQYPPSVMNISVFVRCVAKQNKPLSDCHIHTQAGCGFGAITQKF